MAASQSRRFHLINQLDNTKETFRLRVRVIRCYAVPHYLNKKEINRVEMILLDEQKTKIQASFNDKLLSTFTPKIREGELYSISNFKVVENKDLHKTCTNKWKILFHRNTTVRGISGLDIPIYGFDMVPFDAILEQRQPSEVFVDLIGILKSKSPVKDFGGGDSASKKQTITLVDESERLLEVLLWGDYVDQLNDYLDSHPEQIVVIILQFAKIKYGVGIKHVSNSFFTSRLLMNPKCDAVTSFLARCENIDVNAPYIIENLEVEGSLSIDEEFSKLGRRKYIVDFLRIREPSVCAVAGTIVRVETQHDWSYPSCKTCAHKAIIEQNWTFFCPKCKKTIPYVEQRFKVVYTVRDETGSTSFLMFCREMNQLIGKSATELHQILIENNEDGDFPMELDAIINKQFLFKVNVSDYNISRNYNVYTVGRVTDDPSLLNAHFALLTRDEVDDGDEPDNQSSCLSIPTSQYNISFAGDSSMSVCDTNSLTPCKRLFEDLSAGELGCFMQDGEGSSVKPKSGVNVADGQDGAQLGF